MKPDIWEPPALDEFDRALAASSDPAEFRRVVAEAIRDIATGFVTHAKVTRSPCRKCILRTPPYSIIYIETAAEIRVIAFPHHKRRTGYWKNRLPKT